MSVHNGHLFGIEIRKGLETLAKAILDAKRLEIAANLRFKMGVENINKSDKVIDEILYKGGGNS